MATTQTLWVSGSNVQPAQRGYFMSEVRDGFGSAFYTYGTQWFFFPIPTPLVGGKAASLVKVFLLYKTVGTTVIKAIHLDDGRKKLKLDVLTTAVYGAHDVKPDSMNSWTVGPFQMAFGLNMGAYVDFGPPTKQGTPGIELVAAGAEFQTP
ncbi:MAG TPA: hypothetical protein VFZ85_14405 [Jiangellaceae bacterium]